MLDVPPNEGHLAIIMDEVNDDAKANFRRIELLTGPGRRRRWSVEEKARIVAESLEPGASVSEVARRRQICPQQLFGWRRQLRLNTAGSSAKPDERSQPSFVPLLSEPAVAVTVATSAPSSAAIEITLAGAAVRVRPGVDDELLTAVLRAVRCSSRAP